MIFKKLRTDNKNSLHITTAASLTINIVYAVGNLTFGIVNHSYWFITIGLYFLILSIMRSACINAIRTKSKKEKYIGRLIGLLLVMLCFTLINSIIISDRFDVAEPIHEIIMITIAAFTTLKTVLAVTNTVKARKSGNPVVIALRNISCADAATSILTMQRSMLVSFGDMPENTIRLMNILTGSAICIGIFALAIFSILKNYDDTTETAV